jgi:endonuclease/exonuclease/phosphatase family metal-dependent hydrolase
MGRLEEIAEGLYRTAALDFDHPLECRGDDTVLDGVVGAINMLAEELRSHLDAQVRASRELEASKERYRTLVENTNVVPWEVDATLTVSYIAPQVAVMVGAPPGTRRVAPATGQAQRVTRSLMPRGEHTRRDEPSRSATASRLRVMTWNVHSCVGTDRRLSVERVAEVIGGLDVDVVALQELEVGVDRTGRVDQPQIIAERLGMTCRFSQARRQDGGHFGNALLSRLPLSLRRESQLPGGGTPEREPRVASWADVSVGECHYQLVATHLGLDRRERLAQVQELLGSRWLSHGQCREPRVLLGDLNSIPGSRAYRRLAASLHDVQRRARRPRRTWPSRWPLVRLDHIFCSEGVRVRSTEVPRGRPTNGASDHLPVVAELEWLAVSPDHPGAAGADRE